MDVLPSAVLLPGGHQLSEKVAAHLRDEVMSGRLRGGDFIRPERVASDFGVSATPVREALMALATEGTVTWQPRRGFRVARMTRDDVVDLFDVQAYIAGELAARAVGTMADTDVDALRTLQVQLENAAAARHAMAEHIRHVGDLLADHLAQRGVFDQADPTQAPA